MIKKLLISMIFMLFGQSFAIFDQSKGKSSFEDRLASEGNTIEGVRALLKLYPNKRTEILKKIQSDDFEEFKSVIQALDLCGLFPELHENPIMKQVFHDFVADSKNIDTFLIKDILNHLKDKKTKERLFALIYTEKRSISDLFTLEQLLQIFPDKRNHFFKNIANNFKYHYHNISEIIEIYPDKKEAIFNLIKNNHKNYDLYDFIQFTKIWPNKKDYLFDKIIECLSRPCATNPYFIMKIAGLFPKKKGAFD